MYRFYYLYLSSILRCNSPNKHIVCVFLFNIITYLPSNIIVICFSHICNGECVLTFIGNKEMNE